MIYPEIGVSFTRSVIGPHDTVTCHFETSIEVNEKVIPFTAERTFDSFSPALTFVTLYHEFNQAAKKIYLEKPPTELVTLSKSIKYSF